MAMHRVIDIHGSMEELTNAGWKDDKQIVNYNAFVFFG